MACLILAAQPNAALAACLGVTFSFVVLLTRVTLVVVLVRRQARGSRP